MPADCAFDGCGADYWFFVVKDKMWTVTPTAMQKSRMRSHTWCTRMMLRMMVSHRVTIETALTLREMHLCS